MLPMIGNKFGRLTVIANSSRPRYLVCRCDCGTEKEIRDDHLKNNLSKSCGCLIRDVLLERNALLAKHGMYLTPTYKSWKSMRTRCLNQNSEQFHRYGGRGITVCKEWDNFENFLADMGERPSGTTLDRIDSNGHYEPGNCRWATMKVQENNKRNNVTMTFNGKTLTVAQWADETGIGYQTIRARMKMGWTPEDVLTLPVSKIRRSSRQNLT